MKYDFTSVLDRHGQDAMAVDAIGKPNGFAPSAPDPGFDAIPMWVADMNFPTAPPVTEAILARAAHPAFGYFEPRQEYYDAIIRWHQSRNDVEGMTPECIGYENGVLGGVVSALNVFCSRGDSVLVHSPTYIGFTNPLKNNGYHIVHSPLLYEETGRGGTGEDPAEKSGPAGSGDSVSSGGSGAGAPPMRGTGTWRMDYEDMEEKLRTGRIRAVIFCSPHNPCGRVWTRAELERAYALFERYEVPVISDEIWSDLVLEGHRHIPSQSVSDYARRRTVALYAPSKTFNLAGLVGSYHVIYDRALRNRVRKEASLSHYNMMNVLSMHALIGAYSPAGGEWVDELREVLTGNVRFASEYIRSRFDGVTLAEPEGTYMLFPDCTKWCADHGRSLEELEQLCWRAGAAVQDGKMFHGNCHLRMNLALPRARVEEAMDRLDRYVFNA